MVWECLQQLVWQHEKDGISPDTVVLLRKINIQAQVATDLACSLTGCAAANFQEIADRDVPDPNLPATFRMPQLVSEEADSEDGRRNRRFIADLLQKCRLLIWPFIEGLGVISGRSLDAVDGVVAVDWTAADSRIELRANLTGNLLSCAPVTGNVFYRYPADLSVDIGTRDCRLPSYSIIFAAARLHP